MNIVAIDPGLSGALAITIGNQIIPFHLRDFYVNWHGYKILEGDNVLATILKHSDIGILIVEKQTIMGRDTGKSAITTHTNYGVILSVAMSLEKRGWQVELVHPRTWTTYVGDENCEQQEDIRRYPKNIRTKQSKLNTMAFVVDRLGIDNALPRNRTGNLYDGILDAVAMTIFYQETML